MAFFGNSERSEPTALLATASVTREISVFIKSEQRVISVRMLLFSHDRHSCHQLSKVIVVFYVTRLNWTTCAQSQIGHYHPFASRNTCRRHTAGIY